MSDAQTETPPLGAAEPELGIPSRRLRRVAAVVFALFIAWLVYTFVADWRVTVADERAPRHAETGIRVGAEPLALGPQDASAAVLLVHGFVGGSNNFGDLPRALAESGVYVRAMLLPGHGTSPRDFERTTADALFNAVAEEIEELKKTHAQIFLVGHSMGGTLITLAAAREDVQGIVLAAPYFGVTYYWYYVLRAETWSRLASPLIRWTNKGSMFVQVNRREAKEEIFSYAWIPSKGNLTLLELGERANHPRIREAITCPVLWIHSPGDRAASYQAARDAFEDFPAPDKEALTLTRSNHHVFLDFEREEVSHAIVEFVRDHRP